ncbi:MAG: response regulator transcription factor [Gammaproteobacteria bacterium]|nr:response regulator transcription factor [Gammaproteobacteria bacterium]MBU1846385.1 response regulator transcription factor [Gammaproteobacteria bacterium]
MDRIVGLEFGADDYMVKPFNVLELLARAKAIFRRTEFFRQRPSAALQIEVDNLHIIPDARQVLRDGQALSLTETEFDLLYLLANHPGRVYSRGQLLAHVWGHGSNIYEYTVTSHINRLRAKIETDPGHPRIILTVWGVGYRLHTERSC